MTQDEESNRDWVDLWLLAAIGVLSLVFLLAVLLMLREPHDTIMYVHYLWRRVWIALALVALVVLVGMRVRLRAKGDPSARNQRRRRGLDCLLLVSIAALPMLLFWPPTETGHDPLRPGAQVCRQYPADARAAQAQVNYLLYLPAEYTESRKWPLVVFLHGGGAIGGRFGDNLLYVRAEGLPNQIERGKQFPFILVSPQSPGMRWNAELVVALIDHVSSTLPVDRDRVYLTGNSMGGIGTWHVASHYPDRFAAIVPLCGWGEPVLAERLANLPIWVFHGAKDDRVPLKRSQEMVDAVTRSGGHAKLTVYPDGGHFIDDVTYQNEQLYQWLLAQRRSRN